MANVIEGDVVKDELFNFNFVCQRCCQPLKIDHSFSCLDDQTYSELSDTFLTDATVRETAITHDDIKDYNSSDIITVSRKIIPPTKLTGSNNGFMLVGENGSEASTTSSFNNASMENMGHIMQLTAKLYDILSDQSDVDHPLCEECTDILLNQMDHQLKTVEDECDDYKDVLKQLESSSVLDDSEELKNELMALHEEESKLEAELLQLEEKQKQMKEEEEIQTVTQIKLDEEEERYWKEYCQYKRQALVIDEKQRSIENQLRSAQAHLEKLKRTNVFNATFHIWHSGHFGTINNFRLGKLPNIPIEWSEINAAWGQTVLLLHSLAKKMGLEFQRYKLVPYGSHSFIKVLDDDSKVLPLYGTGGFKFFWDTKIDQAMVAFLDCFQQFKEEVEKGDSGFCLPYKMEKGRIIDASSGNSYSIKIQFNSEEQWTKALKFMLTNLKWGLAWVSSQFNK